jgi:SSS family solute:Na+ symporter
MYGLVGAGALAAAMSSADAITHSAALEVTDGVVHTVKKDIPEQRSLLMLRVAVVVIGGAAYLITIYGGQGLIELLLGAYGSIVQFAPGVYAALYWRRATAPGVLAGLLVGAGLNYFFQFGSTPAPFDIHAGIVGLIANIVVMVAVSYATATRERGKVEEYVTAS